ncbi:hypothetical protein [Deinococcus gobiensis]|nr:hypothetical protein [Deinococcus gobiensis]
MAVREGPLTPANLLDSAPELGQIFDGTALRMADPQYVANTALGPIPEHFPELVKAFIHRGLACIAYSGFYNLLATIGMGQFGMATEAAIREYSLQHGLSLIDPNSKPYGFHNLINNLKRDSLLDDRQVDFWKSTVKLRNYLLHPEENVALDYSIIYINIAVITEELLILFPPPMEVACRTLENP